MILLDTNIVSELQKPLPNPIVQRWLASIGIATTFICGPVVMQQAFGAELHFLKSGSRRYVENLEKLRNEYSQRTLALDDAACELAGRMRARRQSNGRPLSIGDSMIAALCLVNDAVLATRNIRDFDGLDLKLVNPFEAGA